MAERRYAAQRRSQMPSPLQTALLEDATNEHQYGTLMESPRGHVELLDGFNSTAPTATTNPTARARHLPYPGAIATTRHSRRGNTAASEYRRQATSLLHRPSQHPAYSILETREHRSLDTGLTLLSHGLCCLQCVRTQELGIREECGSFDAVVAPGLHVLCWPIYTISGRMSLRLQQMDITCQTLSLDRVFLHLTVSVFFRVSAHRSYEAHYSLQNPREMIQSCVLDAVQSIAPEMTLDELYASQQRIADFCYERLGTHLLDHGFETNRILIQAIEPTQIVREAMDEAAASRALKKAAEHTGQSNKIEIVKRAEGHAERHYLMGVAVSKARKAMVDQMQESAALFADVDVRIRTPPSTSEIMQILLVAQYMDVLEAVNPDGIMVEPEPTALNGIRERLTA